MLMSNTMSANIDRHIATATSRYSDLAGHAHTYPRQQHQSLSPQQTLHSLPQMEEEDAKPAMARAEPCRDVNAAGWSAAMHVLRWLSFLLCMAVTVAEVVVAVCLGPYDDTAIGIIGGTLIGVWDVWRFIYRTKTKRSPDPLAITHLVIEGLLLVLVVVCLAIIGWQATVVSREFFVNRYIPLLIVANLLGVVHGISFCRAWIEQRRDVSAHLPWSHSVEQPPAARIIVQYVQQTCPNCGVQPWPQPGEQINEHLAEKGDNQPQAIPLSQLRQNPHARAQRPVADADEVV